jgi:geranylgeranyl diphosphate synthase, type II
MQSVAIYQQQFQQYLDCHPFGQLAPKALYEPLDYILSIGGKRMRPALVLIAHDLFKSDNATTERALPVAMAVEVFHNFTLMHDDIMDAAPLRRGQATVHTIYGVNVGILSGDVMLVKAYEFLANTETIPRKRLQLWELFNQMAKEVCEGQQEDMNFETRSTVALEEYVEMIAQKTAVLLACALQMGAIVGGATAVQAQHLAAFGRHLGIAFQIQDDVLDTYGDAEKFGKKVGGDIVQNKKTFLVIRALALANEVQHAQLTALMNTTTTDEDTKIKTVRQLFDSLAVRADAERAMETEYQTALQHLAAIRLSAEKYAYVKAFADMLMQREH